MVVKARTQSGIQWVNRRRAVTFGSSELTIKVGRRDDGEVKKWTCRMSMVRNMAVGARVVIIRVVARRRACADTQSRMRRRRTPSCRVPTRVSGNLRRRVSPGCVCATSEDEESVGKIFMGV